MPAQELSTSEFLKTLTKKKGALKKARTVEPKAFGQQVPAGITGGVAKLTNIRMQKTEAGEPFVTFTGVVQRPEEHRGAQVFVTNFLNGSEFSSEQEVLERLCANMKHLGCITDDLEPEHFQGEFEKLVRKQPLFKFNTVKSKSKKNPDRVNVFIQGPADADDADDEPEEEIVDDDQTDDEPEEAPAPAPAAKSGKGGSKKPAAPPDEEEEEEEEEESEDEEPEDEDDDTDWYPVKEDKIEFAPSGKKMYPCTVGIVNQTKKTMTLKRDSDGKLFKGIAWDDQRLGNQLNDPEEDDDEE